MQLPNLAPFLPDPAVAVCLILYLLPVQSMTSRLIHSAIGAGTGSDGACDSAQTPDFGKQKWIALLIQPFHS